MIDSKKLIQTIASAGGISPPALTSPTVWLTHSFAPLWYEDAKREAGDLTRSARRREILFAVPTVESFLFEWVRDIVLKRDFARLNEFFPAKGNRGISEKWKTVIKQLFSEKLISQCPAFGGRTWMDFMKLIEFRNGLVHARASRPSTFELLPELQPLPSVAALDALKPGEATEIVSMLIRELAVATGHQAPNWLV